MRLILLSELYSSYMMTNIYRTKKSGNQKIHFPPIGNMNILLSTLCTLVWSKRHLWETLILFTIIVQVPSGTLFVFVAWNLCEHHCFLAWLSFLCLMCLCVYLFIFVAFFIATIIHSLSPHICTYSMGSSCSKSKRMNRNSK